MIPLAPDRVGAPDTPTLAMVRPEKPSPKFTAADQFFRDLKQRVEAYFVQTGKRQRDSGWMYLKSAIILTWAFTSYALLVFVASEWWQAVPLMLSLGLAMAAIGFNIQHDGNHQAYSDRNWVNRLAGLTMDLLGGSSFLWVRKHNIIHHTYANITDHDDDIRLEPLGRLSPHQQHFFFHRWQHLYLWLFYGFLAVKWQLWEDFSRVYYGAISGRRIPRPKGWDLLVFVLGKLVFLSLAFLVPVLAGHSILMVIGAYLAIMYVLGATLSIVFQLAHCVEEAEFPMPDETGKMPTDWAVHQIQTTVDFARGSRFWTWLLGGLNFQIEHHLFPRICHIHYPAIAPIVEKTCAEYGVRYFAHRTIWGGLASHYRWLRQMGRPTTVGM
jgi:linoleoyl-CoA desaturase